MATELFMLSSPAERAEELVRFVRSNARDADITPLAEAAAKGDHASLISLTLDNQSTIFKNEIYEDTEGAFTLMLSVLPLVPEASRPSVVTNIASAVTSTADTKTSAVRMRM